jgi:hypothetical protein
MILENVTCTKMCPRLRVYVFLSERHINKNSQDTFEDNIRHRLFNEKLMIHEPSVTFNVDGKIKNIIIF